MRKLAQLFPASTLILLWAAWIHVSSAKEAGGEEEAAEAESGVPVINWDEARQFWAYQAPKHQDIPSLPADSAHASWAVNEIDHFILKKLSEHKLAPSPAIDPQSLHRRLAYDLTGLPPSPEEIIQFNQDTASGAYERLVDRLLNSPQFGEHLASMWLNVARYAEDQAHQVGNDSKFFYPNAWRYRQWVIDATNNDLPYNKFVRMQLAADEYGEDGKQHLAALGFLGLGPQYYNRGRLDVLADEWEDRVDTVTRGLLGMTVACARCHQHKYDPVTMRDYYALAGIFASVENDSPEIGGSKLHIVKDLKPKDLTIFNRGNVDDKGPVVKRGFPQILTPGDQDLPVFHEGSGRKQLAEAITDPTNPLTARVMVNRVWGEIFGQPIVRTPSNFGLLGERPSHPELLDFLALQFMEADWSIKRLVRSMVLSAAYRQRSQPQPAKEAESRNIDPGNKWLSRMNRKRLSAEMIRDSMLMASGALESGKGKKSLEISDSKNNHRTVYSRISRLDLDPYLRQFDYPDPNVHAAKRARTTTPGQKLFLMNSPFVNDAGNKIAAATRDISDPRERVDAVYLRILARRPSDQERELGLVFLADDPQDSTRENSQEEDTADERWARFAHVLLCSNAFLYRD